MKKNKLQKSWQTFIGKDGDRKNNWKKQFFYKYTYEKLKTKKNLLDLGCGVGHFLKLKNNNTIGIDKNLENLIEGKKYSSKLVQGNILELPFSDASFDGINCSHVIEHFIPDDAYTLLSEMNRVLKVAGILVISTPVLGSNFYNDFTHVKPYYPEAIMHYYDENRIQKTKNKINCHYKMEEIKWRYEKVPLKPFLFPKGGFLNTLLVLMTDWLSNNGFGKYVETSYSMVLTKIK